MTIDAQDPALRAQRWADRLKWLVGIPLAAIAAPVIFLALKAVLGVVALLVAGGAAMFLVRLAPWWSMKVSNLLIRLIVREAEENPIETLENTFIEKTRELQQADQAIVEFETEIRNYDDQAKEFARQYPDDSADFNEVSGKMHQALVMQKREQAAAREKLADLEVRIDKAKAIYKMALAAQRVTSFSRSAEAKVFQQIKEKVAFESVRSELNRSFASLNMALSQREKIAQLPPAMPRPTVEVVEREKERVRR